MSVMPSPSVSPRSPVTASSPHEKLCEALVSFAKRRTQESQDERRPFLISERDWANLQTIRERDDAIIKMVRTSLTPGLVTKAGWVAIHIESRLRDREKPVGYDEGARDFIAEYTRVIKKSSPTSEEGRPRGRRKTDIEKILPPSYAVPVCMRRDILCREQGAVVAKEHVVSCLGKLDVLIGGEFDLECILKPGVAIEKEPQTPGEFLALIQGFVPKVRTPPKKYVFTSNDVERVIDWWEDLKSDALKNTGFRLTHGDAMQRLLRLRGKQLKRF